MTNRPSSTPLLVVSCDKYADVWPHFFRLLRLRWPDCPFPVFLGSNQLSPAVAGVASIPIGADSSWSTGARKMLDRVSECHPDADYVLLFLEDFFLKARVDTARVVELVRVARDRGVGCLRLAAGLPLAVSPTYELPGVQGVGAIASGEPYRVTLQVAVWRIETLRRLLAPGLSAWEFEQIGSQMSEGLDDAIWAVVKPAIEYDQAIEKGKWKPAGLATLREAGLNPGELSRRVFSEEELAAHFDRSRAQSEVTGYRNAALRNFLVGRRTEGLRHIWRRSGASTPSLSDLGLSLVGLLGSAVTRRALFAYVRMQLWSYARRERNHSRIATGADLPETLE